MSEHDPPTVLIVDDHEVIAQALAVALRQAGFTATVAEVTARAGVLDLVADVRPAVVLLDLHLTADESCVDWIPDLIATPTEVIVLTASADRRELGEAVRAGARTALQKSEPFDVLLDAVRTVLAGGDPLGANRRAAIVDEVRRAEGGESTLLDRFATLTAREAVVLESLVDGRSPAQIADDEFVAVSTVRSQMKSIFRKLGVNSQLAAVALVRRAGWRRPT